MVFLSTSFALLFKLLRSHKFTSKFKTTVKSNVMTRCSITLALLIPLCSALPAHAQLRGHGGPVRALAVSADGTRAISGSFDTSAIRWSLRANAADQVLRFHDGAVNAAVFLKDGRVATSGEDARIAIWKPGEAKPSIVLEGHKAPVVALAVSPDGVPLPTPLNTVAVARDGEIVAAGGDGKVYFLSPAGERAGTVDVGGIPIISVVVSGDGKLVAAAGIRGSVAIIERASRTPLRTLVGPGLPVWSAAFLPDNHTLLTGGTDP